MRSVGLAMAFLAFGAAAYKHIEPTCNTGDGVHTSAPAPDQWAFSPGDYFYGKVDATMKDPKYLRISLGLGVDMGAIKVQFNDKTGNKEALAVNYAYSENRSGGYNDLIIEMNGFVSDRALNCKSDFRISSKVAWKVRSVTVSSSLTDLNQCSCNGFAPTCSSTSELCLAPCPGRTSSGSCGIVSPPRSLGFPVRGTFFYPWFPKTWTVDGKLTHFQPTLGYYSSSDPSVVDKHIRAFEHAKIEMVISSWWGINENWEALILPMYLERAAALNSTVKFATYYEKMGYASKIPSLAQLTSEMSYLKDRYTGHPNFAHVGGKPVMFVWNTYKPSCATADLFYKAGGGHWFVALKIFKGWENCKNPSGNWFQYGNTETGETAVPSQSITIGPGFWKATDAHPTIVRDISRFKGNVRDMVKSNYSWHLVDSFNEFGEGTAVESSKEWGSSSGYGLYLDALHNDGK
jgi:hypothetical protein